MVDKMKKFEENLKIYYETVRSTKDVKLDVDTFINQHNHIRYCEAIIYPDGKIAYANPSHVETLIRYIGIDRETIYNEMDIFDAPIVWLLNKTRCVAIWYDCYLVPNDKKITLAQRITLRKLQDNDIVCFK